MPKNGDIFGLQPTDYPQYKKLMEHGLYEQQVSLMKKEGRVHNFNAINEWYGREREFLNITRAEQAAQALEIMTSNLETTDAFVEKVLRMGIRYDRTIPMKMDIPEGASSYRQYIVDGAGEGEFISNDGSDIPTATTSQRSYTAQLDYAGNGAEWTIEEPFPRMHLWFQDYLS